MKTRRLGAAALLSSAFLPATALAAVTFTTLPGPETGGPCFGNGNLASVGVEIPAGDDYTLNEVTVRLHDTSNGGTPFTLAVYDDAAGLPGSAVATIGSGTGTGTFDLYTLTPTAPITLQAGETYWITASSSSTDGCAFGWSFDGTDPAGSTFSYTGEQQFLSGSWNDRTGSYQQLEIDADPAAPAATTSIPTLSQWGLLLLGVGVMAMAGFVRRPE